VEVILLPQAMEDVEYWKKSGKKQVEQKITDLIKAIVESPFTGIGNPETDDGNVINIGPEQFGGYYQGIGKA
jgi:Txe/YoeB family toxin of Txe-Axe toxin-antitoxin module